jgi:CheY-like chemotaxis protein
VVPQTVLIVDDDVASLELVRYLLEARGLNILSANDGAEALALAAAHRPDAIVLDLDLPVLNGCEVQERLHAEPLLAAIPLVVTSVYEIDEFCPGRGRADFAAYIRKPLDPTTFADEVSAAIANAKES